MRAPGLVFIATLLLAPPAEAADPKPIEDVDMNGVIDDGQVSVASNAALDMAWWIPTEYWASVLGHSPMLGADQVDHIVSIFSPYSILAVVQADISPLGAMSFLDEDIVGEGMSIRYIDASGTAMPVAPVESVDPDLALMLNQMTPTLAASMGELGRNFHFFVLPDAADTTGRLISPYAAGAIVVTLAAREGAEPTTLTVELPFDSLHEPRLCPNGKPAHVTWNYCPWGGEPLD